MPLAPAAVAAAARRNCLIPRMAAVSVCHAGYHNPRNPEDRQRANMPGTPDRWTTLLFDDSGVSSIEYALVGSLIAVVIVGTLFTVGDSVKTLYQGIADKVQKR